MRKRKSGARFMRPSIRSESILKVKKALNTGFLLSIGLASIAKENAENIVGEIVRKGRLNEKQEGERKSQKNIDAVMLI